MQNFGVTNKEHYGMLWYFLEWSIQPLIFPHRPLPLSQGLDECPTPPHLSSSSGSPNGDQQINQPHAHDFCFSCALEQEYFWHFSCFYLFLNFLQLTDCFLLLVFPFFLTHYIQFKHCALSQFVPEAKIASFNSISSFFIQKTKMLFPLNLFFWCNNNLYVAASG